MSIANLQLAILEDSFFNVHAVSKFVKSNPVRFGVKTICNWLILLLVLNGCSGSKRHVPQYYSKEGRKLFREQQLLKTLNLDSLDLELLEWAVFEETNVQRLRVGLPPLKYESDLQSGARQHSEEMSELGYFSHYSPVPQNETVVRRLKNAGISAGLSGENIAIHPLIKKQNLEFHLPPTIEYQRLFWRNSGLPYNYQDFAKDLVRRWLNSMGHRRNILNKHFKFLGVGAVSGRFDERDVFYVTQNFSTNNR